MADKGDNSLKAMVEQLNQTLADHFALYIKTKSFHWHLAGPRFRDLHLLFDEQAAQIIGVTDAMAERARKKDAATITSIGSIARHARIKDEDKTTLDADAMVKALHGDNVKLVEDLKALREAAEGAGDAVTSAMVDDWQDAAEERAWFLRQALK